MGNVKGSAVRSFVEYLKSRGGEAGWRRALATLTPEESVELSRPILPVHWYDYGSVIRLLLAADKLFGRGDRQLLREAGIYNAHQDLRGIYRMFISYTSPQYVINNSGRVWKQYYDRGQLAVAWQNNKGGALKMTGFPDIPLHHDAQQLGYMEEAFRISGGKNIRGHHPRCIARGDDHCLYEFTWD